MDQRSVGKEVRMRERAEIVRECRSSGMSVTAWCREKDICKGTYFRWQRQVREYAVSLMNVTGSAVAEKPGQKAELSVPSGWAMCATSVPTPEVAAVASAAVTIEIGICRVTADEDVSTELLTKVCKVLVELC
jgi:Transposase.